MPLLDKSLVQMAHQLLQGGYDLHMHAAPSPFNRLMDDFALLEDAGRAGMGGIMLKSHYEPTAARAAIANAHCNSKAVAYGAVVLNCPVGGLNPYAVENALKRDGKIIWMPTRDAKNSLHTGDMPGDFFSREGITVLDEKGELKPEVLELMDIVKKYDAALATGHLSPEESVLLCREGVGKGIRMVLTHPEFERTAVAPAVQKELADEGVYIEKCWYNIAEGDCTAEEMAKHIRFIGAEHCFLSTDRGQKGRETPVEAMCLFICALIEQGITQEEVSVMLRDNPRRILGLLP